MYIFTIAPSFKGLHRTSLWWTASENGVDVISCLASTGCLSRTDMSGQDLFIFKIGTVWTWWVRTVFPETMCWLEVWLRGTWHIVSWGLTWMWSWAFRTPPPPPGVQAEHMTGTVSANKWGKDRMEQRCRAGWRGWWRNEFLASPWPARIGFSASARRSDSLGWGAVGTAGYRTAAHVSTYPEASRDPLTTKTVLRHCGMYPWGTNYTHSRTTDLGLNQPAAGVQGSCRCFRRQKQPEKIQ